MTWTAVPHPMPLSAVAGLLTLALLLVWRPRHTSGRGTAPGIGLLAGALLPLGYSLHPLTPTLLALVVIGSLLAAGLFRDELGELMSGACDALIKATDDGVIVLDKRERIVTLNPAAERLIGQPASKVSGQPVAEALAHHPALVEQLSPLPDAPQETVLPIADRIAELRILPVPGRRDALKGHVLALRDVTAQERTQELLEESQRRLATLTSNLPGMVYRCRNEPSWTMEFVSAGTEALTGYQPDDLIKNQTIAYGDLIHPDDRSDVWHTIQDSVQKRRSFQVIYRIVTASGQQKWVWEQGQPTAFAGDEVTHLEGFITDITEQKTAEETLHRRTAQLEALRAVGLELAAELDLDELLQAIVTRAITLVDGTAGGLDLYQPDRDVMQLAASKGLGFLPEETVLQRGEGLSGRVLDSEKPLIVDDYGSWEHRITHWERQETPQCVIGVPVRWGERLLGVLIVLRDRSNPFTQDDVDFLSLFATQAAIALHNARLHEEAQRWAAQATLIYDVGQRVSGELELDPLLSTIVKNIHAAFGYHSVILLLLDDDNEQLLVQAAAGGYADRLTSDIKIALGEGMTGYAASTGEPQLSNDVSQNPHYVRKVDEDTKSELAVPIKSGSRVLGVLDIQDDTLNAFDDVDVSTVETLSAQIATAIENARLFQAERAQRRKSEALQKAAAVVNSTLELNEVLDHILTQVRHVIGGDACNVMLIEDDRARIVRQQGYERFGMKDLMVEFAFHIPKIPNLQQMLETGEPMMIPDTSIHPDWIERPDQDWLLSFASAPIHVQENIVGFLNVDSATRGFFKAEHAQTLKTFADYAATAIENAQLYQELRNHAQDMEARVEERTAQLRAQFAQLEAILNSITDGIIVTGPKGELILANPVAHTWLNQALPPDESRTLRETVRALAVHAGERPEQVLELTGLDLQLKAAPISGPTIEQVKAVVAIRDISHLKSLERMKSRFITNVSHELRTPITTIQLYSQLMEQQPERWREHLKVLTEESQHLAQLVNDIMDVSRIDAGRVKLNRRPTNLNDLLEIALINYQTQAKQRHITLEKQPAAPGPMAMADPRRSMQALDNLVSNAIQYTPENGRVTISTAEQAMDGRRWATVTVTDTGAGIPQEELDHIFERFFRGETPQREQISGTGLGLALVKELVKLHGGRVTVESDVGQGSSFTIWLPIANIR